MRLPEEEGQTGQDAGHAGHVDEPCLRNDQDVPGLHQHVAAEIALLNHGLKVQADEHSAVGEFFHLADGRRQLRGSPTPPHDVYGRRRRNTPLHWASGHGQRLQDTHVAAEHVDAGTAHIAEDKKRLLSSSGTSSVSPGCSATLYCMSWRTRRSSRGRGWFSPDVRTRRAWVIEAFSVSPPAADRASRTVAPGLNA